VSIFYNQVFING